MLSVASISELPVSSVEGPKVALVASVSASANAVATYFCSTTLSMTAVLEVSLAETHEASVELSSSVAATASSVTIHGGSVSLSCTASISVNSFYAIYAATTDYITGTSDSPANTLFPGTVETPLRFQRTIIGNNEIGAAVVGFGQMILKNADGAYDSLIDTHSIEGRRVVVHLGDKDSAYGTFGIIFDGTASSWHPDEESFTIELRDKSYLLEQSIQENVFAGTGGVEGTENNEGQRLPLTYGECLNISPILIDPSELIFKFHDGQAQSVDNVYVRGFALNDGATDYADYASLKAATVTGGDFVTCLAEGLFRINFLLEGQVTADVKGDATDSSYVNTTSTIIERILLNRTSLTSSDLDSVTFSTVETDQPAVVGIYIDPSQTLTTSQVIELLMFGIGGYSGFNRSGLFQISLFTMPSTDSSDAVISVSETEIIGSISRVRPLEAYNPPIWRSRVAWGRNFTIQDSDLAEAVQEDEDRQAWLAEPYRLGISDETEGETVKFNHLLATDYPIVESYFINQADAVEEAERQFDLWSTPRSVYSMVLKTQPFILDIGDTFRVSYPRWNLTEGKNLRVVSITENADDNVVELVGIG